MATLGHFMDKQSKELFLISQSGFSMMSFLISMAVVFSIGQQMLLIRQQQQFETQLRMNKFETQMFALNSLTDLLTESLALRNSRFSSNAKLYECLMGNPNPCNETESWDMILYSPNPPMIFTGGIWPVAPNGIAILAGGKDTNKIFLNQAGGVCPDNTLTSPSITCPLQSIVQFKTMCGGSFTVPTFQSTPGPCPGRATGFEITIGVGSLRGNEFIYNGATGPNPDAKSVIVRAADIVN